MVELGVLRVLALGDPEEVACHGRLVERHYPYISMPPRYTPDHPGGIPNAVAEVDALLYIGALGCKMVTEVDALCTSCALDPSVKALDEALSIPAVDVGTSVATVVSARGERVGTLGLENGVKSAIRDLLGDRPAVEEAVRDVATTNYLTTDEGRATTRATVDRFVDADCDVVVPSCTDISSLDTTSNARANVPISIADPVVAVGTVATTAVTPPCPPWQ